MHTAEDAYAHTSMHTHLCTHMYTCTHTCAHTFALALALARIDRTIPRHVDLRRVAVYKVKYTSIKYLVM